MPGFYQRGGGGGNGESVAQSPPASVQSGMKIPFEVAATAHVVTIIVVLTAVYHFPEFLLGGDSSPMLVAAGVLAGAYAVRFAALWTNHRDHKRPADHP